MERLDYKSITAEQMKLLNSSIRVRIMYALKGKSMTAKQLADHLGESSGNVHYHVQKLFKGGLLDLVETKEVGGIVEKYYRSEADMFAFVGSPSGDAIVPGKTRTHGLAYLRVTESELQEFMSELLNLLSKWERRSASAGSFEVVYDMLITIPTNAGSSLAQDDNKE